MYYNRYRYYDPDSCSYISQDPLGLAAGTNLYRYAPNVWGWIDPLGLCKESLENIEDPNIEKNYPPRTEKSIRESKHVAMEIDKIATKKKNPSITVFTHENDTVSVGISGESSVKNIDKAKQIEDHLNKDLGFKKYTVSGESMPTNNLDRARGGNEIGVCSEPKASKAAHDNPSSIDGFDSRWRGKTDNPHPYTGENTDNVPVDRNQMDPCATCADPQNAKEYMDYANAKPKD